MLHFRAASAPALLLLLVAGATGAVAQGVIDEREQLDEGRPEAWAMRWFSAALTPTAFGVPDASEPGRLELALEAAWIPQLSEEQRTIGFDGTKVEDLNRSPVAGGPRVWYALPAGWTVDATWMPPIEVDGATANLVGVGAARPLWEGEGLRLGFRLSAFAGDLKGDFTCSEDEAAAGPDPEANPYACEAASNDELDLAVFALELAAARRFERWPEAEAWVAAIVRHVDATFQVDARYAGLIDHTRLDYDGLDWGVAAGLGWRAGEQWRWVAEVDWTPLDVDVEPVGRGHDVYDPMINVRLGIGYRLR